MISTTERIETTRWAPTSCKWSYDSYNPYKLTSKLVTGVITLLIGVITQFIIFIAVGGPTLYLSIEAQSGPQKTSYK